MCKYYFAYHYWNGQFWPMSWYTEDSITMGGHPSVVTGTLTEISSEEYKSSLNELAEKYAPSRGSWISIRKELGLT